MKAILLSVKPKELVDILNGKQNVIIRKKFRKDYVGWVYLYCTKDKTLFNAEDGYHYCSKKIECDLSGKVVAHVWCDVVDILKTFSTIDQKVCCGFHISQLEIFDRPRELNEYFTLYNCRKPCDSYKETNICIGCKNKRLNSAPKNYCYVDALA